MSRASDWIVPEHGVIRTCSAEDLIVPKAFAARPQDWIDVEKVIVRQGDRLDRDQIRTELAPLIVQLLADGGFDLGQKIGWSKNGEAKKIGETMRFPRR